VDHWAIGPDGITLFHVEQWGDGTETMTTQDGHKYMWDTTGHVWESSGGGPWRDGRQDMPKSQTIFAPGDGVDSFTYYSWNGSYWARHDLKGEFVFEQDPP